jgi:hypothetical protein
METTRAEDPKLLGLKAMVSAMAECVGLGVAMTAKDIVAKAHETRPKTGTDGAITGPVEQATPELKDALVMVASDRGSIDTARLGYWLRANAGRVIDDMHIEKAGESRTGISQWHVVKTD